MAVQDTAAFAALHAAHAARLDAHAARLDGHDARLTAAETANTALAERLARLQLARDAAHGETDGVDRTPDQAGDRK